MNFSEREDIRKHRTDHNVDDQLFEEKEIVQLACYLYIVLLLFCIFSNYELIPRSDQQNVIT